MKKTFKYRLYPTKPHLRTMQATLDSCRWVYNQALAARKSAWEQQQTSLSTFYTIKLLPGWKNENPPLGQVHSQVLQNAVGRVGLAFDEFFRRVKAGEKEPGYPRFKGRNRYDSFTFPQHYQTKKTIAGQKKNFIFYVYQSGNHWFVHLPNIGEVKLVYHRPMEGEIKTLTISRSKTGKWYACFSCDGVPEQPRVPTGQMVGLDLGLYTYAAFSNGEMIGNPRFLRQDQPSLKQAQRRYSKVLEVCKPVWAKGEQTSPELDRERHRRGKVVCRIYERVAFRRDNFAHQLSHALVRDYDLIGLEDLDIAEMVEYKDGQFRRASAKGLKKSVYDAAWRRLRNYTVSKAVEAGSWCVLVNPRGTSQRCHACGEVQKKRLSDRVHCCQNTNCPLYGQPIDRDLNAALNVLQLALEQTGWGLPSVRQADRSSPLKGESSHWTNKDYSS